MFGICDWVPSSCLAPIPDYASLMLVSRTLFKLPLSCSCQALIQNSPTHYAPLKLIFQTISLLVLLSNYYSKPYHLIILLSSRYIIFGNMSTPLAGTDKFGRHF